jgi:hypothetical protein
MAEVHITWDLVNTDPVYVPIFAGERFQFSLGGIFWLDCRMTLSACGYIRHVHHFTRIRIRVAHFASHLQIRYVQLMIKPDRLRGAFRLFRLTVQ